MNLRKLLRQKSIDWDEITEIKDGCLIKKKVLYKADDTEVVFEETKVVIASEVKDIDAKIAVLTKQKESLNKLSK